MSESADPPPSGLQIVHEGRGGHIRIGSRQYAIEHIEGGCFVIHFPGGQRHSQLDAHHDLLNALVIAAPGKWHLQTQRKRTGTRR